MNVIATTAALEKFCAEAMTARYVTVDTEFMRENTYYPKLCLLQIASAHDAVLIDPLAEGIDLAPVFALMAAPQVLKVFHAARQDIEIFVHLSGAVPAPIFDTQIAGMACGFGDAISYDRLVKSIVGVEIDKSSRFTDWARRPLGERQLTYALSDVTHLRPVFEALEKRLRGNGRETWLADEMAVLTDRATYVVAPEEAWRRLKLRNPKPRTLAILRELAALRENEARRRDLPRNRVLRDEVLTEIAASMPRSPEELARARSISDNVAKGKLGQLILQAVRRGADSDRDSWPRPATATPPRRGREPVVELLRVLLKLKAEEHGVAQKLIASMADLDLIADDDGADVPALSGWRREIFGDAAIALKQGGLALTIRDGEIAPIAL